MRSVRKTFIGATVLAVVAALLSGTGPAQAAASEYGTPFVFENSGKCMNVAGGSLADGAKVIQYQCAGDSAYNDKWIVVPKGGNHYWLRSVTSGKCLTVRGASTADNASLIQYACANGGNELWAIESQPARPTVRLISAGSGKCVNVPGGSTANNVNLVQYTCQPGDGTTNERAISPPTTSAAVLHRPFTSKQPVAVIQGGKPPSGGTAPVSYSWIDAANQLETVTDFNPDPVQPDPNAPAATGTVTQGYGYTGRPEVALLADKRVEVVAHDAAAGDLQYIDESRAGTGDYSTIADVGGALSGQPTVSAYTTGQLAFYAVINGQIWFNPETAGNPQPPIGNWSNLGPGPDAPAGLTGVPVAVPTSSGVRLFVPTTYGDIATSDLEDGYIPGLWGIMGGTGLTDMSVLTLPGNRVFLVARDASGTVEYIRQTGDNDWDGWHTIPGVASAGTPSAVVGSADGKIDIAIRGTDNLLYVAQETAASSNQFGGWTQISDPATDPDTVAASDPTAFGYDVPSGHSFGVVFRSTTTIDGPYGIYFAPGWTATPPAAAIAKTPTGLRFKAVAKPKTMKKLTAAK